MFRVSGAQQASHVLSPVPAQQIPILWPRSPPETPSSQAPSTQLRAPASTQVGLGFGVQGQGYIAKLSQQVQLAGVQVPEPEHLSHERLLDVLCVWWV